ncbi:PfkB family carbohydrate kinase [Acidipila rosea]|uniref:Sugar/nucleoside kinase (Ribokinase family) n=1 Tax=Acidipila rosea TaxID=768535 RepID=A0A4R1L6C8_9BACT|nr:PfkB family carbohydrate kinase [Acidipila rosea]MBW4026833.1 sugar kinase [Acidobacteriota bacterium]MBW4043412.1 sugar kinase [Acidobacteriota bacterium]TCK73715.1 sugar/nucleoside kinase (ribokinase family) [Acidipila rosea]
MSILVVGSVAFDTIETPSGRAERCLGGAATYFALAASYFTHVRVIGVVGEDFTEEHESILKARDIDTRGIEHVDGKSFFWSGSYHDNLNEAKTLSTELNVFESFSPKIPAEYANSEHLFLANIDPVLQERVRSQMPNVRIVCGDTMNYWITGHRANLEKVLKGLDVLLINDTEAKLLADDANLVRAADRVLSMGPKSLVVKHGEYGATAFFSEESFTGKPHITLPFRAPALPLSEVFDPTGAGDSFAGGFFGSLAAAGELTPAAFKTAMFYGGVMGSFAVERFGTERTQQLTREEIDQRFALFRELSHLD